MQRYIYRRDDDGEWLKQMKQFFFNFWNENPSLTVPDDSNWKYADPNLQRFFVDPQLKLVKLLDNNNSKFN